MFVTCNGINHDLKYRPYPPWGDTDDIILTLKVETKWANPKLPTSMKAMTL
jgi:hypothetical protein